MSIRTLLTLSALSVLLWQTAASAFECKVCHSKNPKMVAMHKALEGKNCFGCHKVGDKLMGKEQPKDLNSLMKRRASDAECLPCHGSKM